MPSFKETVTEFKLLLAKTPSLEMMHIYYADDIVQIENDEPAIVGKDVIMKMEKENLSKIIWHKESIITMLIDEEKQIVMGEMLIQFETKKHQKKKLEEAFIQHWQNGQIKYQRFYYKQFTDYNE
jgi:hypothetical protein